MDVVTIGETMVLFSPESNGYLRYETRFTRSFAGAESNFAIGLARLGHRAGWISRVGNDELGKAMLSFIRGEGVDVSQVQKDMEAPTGLYIKEVRNSSDLRVYYYRKGSAASQMAPTDLNEEYFKGAKYLFLTGITPALSETCHEMVMESISIARKHGLKVIFDPNLRKKLWSEEKARSVLLDITSKVDIVLPGLSEGEFLFGESDPLKLGQLFIDQGPSLVVLKLGEKGAHYFTSYSDEFVPGFKVEQVVDPIGAGDGFAAGFVSGLLDELSLHDAIRRANAVGAIVTTISGDVEGLPEREDLARLIHAPKEDVNR